MASQSLEFNDTYGTTLVFICTPELVVFTTDSRTTQSRSGRVDSDDETKYVKIITSTSTVYATGTGSSIKFKELCKEVQEKRPVAYKLSKMSPREESVSTITSYFVIGAGLAHALNLLKIKWKDNISETDAVELGVMALSLSAIGNPYTGGIIRVLVFDSKGIKECSSKSITTLDAYLTFYNQWNEDHPNTINLFSLGRSSDGAVRQWFGSGCLITKVDVTSVHVIGQIQGYFVRHVVLKDKNPLTILAKVQNICDSFDCREETNVEITTFPCLSILNEKFYFAQLTREKLSEICG
ncbi:hypothetical protein OROMI_000850 [Orobanche minor]